MGKASTKKRVQRASGAKKMAMRGKRRPYGFYALIAVLVVVGVGGIVPARGGSHARARGARPALPDHSDTPHARDIRGTIQPHMPQPAPIANLNNPNAGEANGTTPTS